MIDDSWQTINQFKEGRNSSITNLGMATRNNGIKKENQYLKI